MSSRGTPICIQTRALVKRRVGLSLDRAHDRVSGWKAGLDLTPMRPQPGLRSFAAAILVAVALPLLAAVPAQAAVTITITATPATLHHGEATTIGGHAKGARAGSVVRLQRRLDGAWRNVDERRLGDGRSYAFRFAPPRGYPRYRVVLPRQLGQDPVASSPVTLTVKWKPSITGTIKRFRRDDGVWVTRVVGEARSHSGGLLIVQKRVDGRWLSTKESSRVSASGTYRFDFVKRPIGSRFRLYAPRVGARLAAWSPTVSIDKLPYVTTISASVFVLYEPSGPVVDIGGSVLPYRETAVVRLQELVDGEWVNQQEFQLSCCGGYRFLQPLSGQHGAQRVVVEADGSHTADTESLPDLSEILNFEGVVNGPGVSVWDRLGGRERRIWFAGKAGDLISYRITDGNLFGTPSVINENGAPVPNFVVGDAEYKRLWQLPADGRYALRLIPGPSSFHAGIVQLDRQVDVDAVLNTEYPLILERGQAAVIELPVEEGEELSLALDNRGLFLDAFVSGPQGPVLSPWPPLESLYRHGVPVTGTYVITLVNSSDYTQYVTFAASVPRWFTTIPNAGPVEMPPPVMGQVTRVVFEASAADLISHFATVGGSLHDYSGHPVPDGFGLGASGAFWILPQDGQYYFEYAQQEVWYSALESTEVTRGISVEGVVNGPPLVLTTSRPGQGFEIWFDAKHGDHVTIALDDGSPDTHVYGVINGEGLSPYCSDTCSFTAPRTSRYVLRSYLDDPGSITATLTVP